MVEVFSITSDSEDNTREVAKKIAPLFRPGDRIILDGDLGAGKTCFVKGFTEGLCSEDIVTSPTFSIANFYRTNEQCQILHIDIYRIATMDEFNDLGLTDYFEQSIVLVEWGKKFIDIFEDFMLVSFQIKDDHQRVLTFEYQGDKYESIMNGIKNASKMHGLQISASKTLKGDTLC